MQHFLSEFSFSDHSIEWDEAAICKKQKHHKGSTRPPIWALSGVQHGTGFIALEPVAERDADTLQTFIKEHSIVCATHITDGWRAYLGLDAMGYFHWNLNHSIGFVHEFTGFYINTINGLWSLVRDDFRRFRGLQRQRLQSFLDEFAFRRNMKMTDTGLWMKFLLVIGTKQHTTHKPKFY